MTASSIPLELPITLRIPFPDEVPRNEAVLDKIQKSQSAKIIEGYTLKMKDDNPANLGLEFEFYAEINIDNSRLWDLFIKLADFLPDDVLLLSGHIDDEELNCSEYHSKDEVLNFLKQYERELTSDTFLKFGLLFHSEKQLTEVFVDETKYIKFWGSDKIAFEKLLNNFALAKIEDLEFIDEYPKLRQSLITLDNSVTDTENLLEILQKKFT